MKSVNPSTNTYLVVTLWCAVCGTLDWCTCDEFVALISMITEHQKATISILSRHLRRRCIHFTMQTFIN